MNKLDTRMKTTCLQKLDTPARNTWVIACALVTKYWPPSQVVNHLGEASGKGLRERLPSSCHSS